MKTQKINTGERGVLNVQPPLKRQRATLSTKSTKEALKGIKRVSSLRQETSLAFQGSVRRLLAEKSAQKNSSVIKKATLESLPVASLANIMGYLSFGENSIPWASIYRVNKFFKSLFHNREFKSVLPKEVAISNLKHGKYLSFLNGRLLKRLFIRTERGCKSALLDENLKALKGMPLEALELPSSHKITDEGVKNFIGSLSDGETIHKERRIALKHLCLYNCEIGNEFLRCLSGMPLEHLELSFCIQGLQLAGLQNFPLKKLNLTGCEGLFGNIAYLNKETLTHLDLFGVRGLNEESIKALNGFKRLKFLNLSQSELSNDYLKLLDLPSLETLEIAGCYEETTDEGLLCLKKFPSLKRLNLNSLNSITDEGLEHITSLPLVHLNLRGMDEITERGIAKLIKISTLRELDLSNTEVGDESIRHLKAMNLTKLNVEGAKLTDVGIASLDNTSLEEVYVGEDLLSRFFMDFSFKVSACPSCKKNWYEGRWDDTTYH